MNYYIADTHFGHQNILKLCDRPFSSIDDMNNQIIMNWNKKVTGKDNVYIVGDMFFKHASPQEILRQLKGKKHLILGNHDSWAKDLDLNKYFVSVQHLKEISDGKNFVILCHYPLVTYKHENRINAFMVHGHLHNKTDNDIFPFLSKRPSILNAGVDINGFSPVTLEELIENNNSHFCR